VIYEFTIIVGEATPPTQIKPSVGGVTFKSISEDDGSLCLGIASIEAVENGRFTNAAPCLLEAPEASYELQLL